MKSKLISLTVKLLSSLSKVTGVDIERFFIHYIHSTNSVNRHILSSENNSLFYLSHLPDRYSDNFAQYQKQSNFLEYKDINKWIDGNYFNNSGDLGRFFFLNLCIESLLDENIIGNVMEIGVYKGNSGFLLAKYARQVGTTCYLFDTYEGFDQRDIQGIDSNTNKDSFKDTSLADVKRVVGEENTTYVKGYFPESLEQVGELESFSIVHIDCDLEKPIAESLEYFYPRMVKGGFLIMHDYSSMYWAGAKKAIDSFFSDKPEYVIPIPDKSGTCVVRKI
ncbi:TylF/MycF/NovP-related O-methyltransferase [Bernardetia sp.]|uniref:TylF/MycF/NovP-related O-methyltransferase n=1 Tax=Bernardetia sp. TaxID=1937974 RepID=UPI0025C67843|nr:TylF/MycF/NovP-related O-methyltransferase [Bernardetia sp.]